MEGVEVVHGQNVDVFLHQSHAEEMASAVEHATAIAKAGLVGDACGGQVDACLLLHGQRLAQGLYAVEHACRCATFDGDALGLDRKSTRLNSSHANISYAVFCLKKKKL